LLYHNRYTLVKHPYGKLYIPNVRDEMIVRPLRLRFRTASTANAYSRAVAERFNRIFRRRKSEEEQ